MCSQRGLGIPEEDLIVQYNPPASVMDRRGHHPTAYPVTWRVSCASSVSYSNLSFCWINLTFSGQKFSDIQTFSLSLKSWLEKYSFLPKLTQETYKSSMGAYDSLKQIHHANLNLPHSGCSIAWFQGYSFLHRNLRDCEGENNMVDSATRKQIKWSQNS